MGVWGTGILQDDTVADVVGSIKDLMKKGQPLAAAVAEVRKQFAELEQDPDEAPLLWLGIAHAEWKYGKVQAIVLDRIRSDIAQENGLERWREDPKALAKRKASLRKFLTQVEEPNPKLSAPPKLVVRKAPFRKGDCLSISLPEGRYTAALVLNEDNSNPELGRNLIGSLDYWETQPPDLAVFNARRWLKRTWGAWDGSPEILWYLPVGFREASKRISVVGNVKLKWLDPRSATQYASWKGFGDGILYSVGAKDA